MLSPLAIAIDALAALFLLGALPCQLQLAQTLEVGVGSTRAEHRLVDLDADGKTELLWIGREGEVRVYRHGDEDVLLSPKALGDLTLAEPRHCLIALARMRAGSKQLQLVSASPEGVLLYSLEPGGGFAKKGERLLGRASFRIRTGRPTFARIVQDPNRDSRPDLVLPAGESLVLYLNQEVSETSLPRFRRTGRVAVEVSQSQQSNATALSKELRQSFSIPNLHSQDVNGDGRPDLLVEDEETRAWHLQRQDGSFPALADQSLDLAIFRDTTPMPGLQLGQTLAFLDKAQYQSRDLNDDGIPDYVIAHGRKVWVFHGGKDGPQFKEPSSILKVAEDITGVLLIDLDQDPFPDLLITKVQVPTIAALLLGYLKEWNVEIRTIGYASEAGQTFEKKPRWKNRISLRLPAIRKLMATPESFVERFMQAGKKFRLSVEGDLDGNGAEDVGLLSEDEKELHYWLLPRSEHGKKQSRDAEIRRLLFDNKDPVWDIDRVLRFLDALAQRRVTRLTGDRPRSGAVSLRDPSHYNLVSAEAADLDGDGRHEVVLLYESWEGKKSASMDLLRLARKR